MQQSEIRNGKEVEKEKKKNHIDAPTWNRFNCAFVKVSVRFEQRLHGAHEEPKDTITMRLGLSVSDRANRTLQSATWIVR